MRTQNELDVALDREYVIPVEIDQRGGLPVDKPEYDCIRNINQTGFRITARQLLHAIGCKNACLPMSEKDECLKSAYLFTKILNFDGQNLRFIDGIESDLQTVRSQEIGIGVTCLFANRFWQIPWDQLVQIPGPGKRFDYRGEANGVQAIFEAKGTKYLSKQASQIQSGLEKKEAHHNRGDNFNVELIISTSIGTGNSSPRIMLADPEFDSFEFAFGDLAKMFFRYRHYSRVMQFIGATKSARRLYLDSNKILKHNRIDFRQETTGHEFIQNLVEITIEDKIYLGRWFDKWIPENSKRYARIYDKYHDRSFAPFSIRVFQGVDIDVIKRLFSGELEDIDISTEIRKIRIGISEDLPIASLFPDGTALITELILN